MLFEVKKGVKEFENESVKNISINVSTLRIIKSFDVFTLVKNQTVFVNLSEYFDGAKEYSIDIPNISTGIADSILELRAQEDFKGIARGTIRAFSENASVESRVVVIVSGGNLTVTTLRDKIELGKPVRWRKIILDSSGSLNVTLPVFAENISIAKVEEGMEQQAAAIVKGTKDKEARLQKIYEPRAYISGLIVREQEPSKNVFSYFKQLYSFLTGKATFEEVTPSLIFVEGTNESVIEVTLLDNATQYVLEYYTPGPEIGQEEIIGNSKKIVISAPDEYAYTDIVASASLDFLNLSMSEIGNLKLEWYNHDFRNASLAVPVKSVEEVGNVQIVEEKKFDENGSMVDVKNDSIAYIEGNLSLDLGTSFNYQGNTFVSLNGSGGDVEGVDYVKQEIPLRILDVDNDSIADRAEWVVGHLSNQTFFIYLLNYTYGVNITTTGDYFHLLMNTTYAYTYPYNYLRAYWSFDSDNSTTLNDISEINNAGFYNGTLLNRTGCLFGRCGVFNGINNSIRINDASDPSGYTVTFWLKPFSTVDQNIFVRTDSTGPDSFVSQQLRIKSGKFEHLAKETAGANRITTSTTSVVAGRWYHVAIIAGLNALAQRYSELYVNGVSEASAAMGNPLSTQGDRYFMGINATDGASGSLGYYNGTIDEVMFFTAYLNSSLMSDIYTNQSPRFVRQGSIEKPVSINSSTGEGNSTVQVRTEDYLRGAVMENISVGIKYGIGYNKSTSDGLAGFWSFDTNFSDELSNKGAAQNHSFINNNSGIYAASLKLDGIDDWVNTSTTGLSDLEHPLTIAAWIDISNKTNGEFGGGMYQQTIYSSDYDASGWEQYLLYLTCPSSSSTNVTITMEKHAISYEAHIVELPIKNCSKPTGWFHIAFTEAADPTNISKFYYNGNKIGSDGVFTQSIFTGSRPQHGIGAVCIYNCVDRGYYLNGSIDNLMIFNRELSSSEVFEVFHNGRVNWSTMGYQNLSKTDNNDNSSLNLFNISARSSFLTASILLDSGAKLFYTPLFSAVRNISITVLSSEGQYTNCSTQGCLIIKNASYSNVSIFDRNGNLDLRGTLTQSSVGSPDGSDFVIKDSAGNVRAWIDGATGNMRIAGTLTQNYGSPCSPPSNSFIINNKTTGCVAYIDSNGNLWLRGGLGEGVTTL